jgi:hypothetical protein
MPMPPGSWNIEDSEPLRPIKAVPRGPPVRRRIISNEETENDPEKLRRILKERIKELNGLYALTQIAEAKIDSIEEVDGGNRLPSTSMENPSERSSSAIWRKDRLPLKALF